jgi:1-acyl-sn-glycerol-3-phosphate acyltransferase
VVYSLSRVLVRLILRLGFRFRVEGREHEPATGPLLVVCNHTSDLDPLVVGAALRRRVRFMAKVELFRPSLLRWWVSACGAFPVRRGEADRQAFRTARTILEHGGALVMFPEGTRGAGRHDLRPPEPGAAALAIRTGATILPAAILGTDRVLPRGARRLTRAPIQVRVGPAIRPDGEGAPSRTGPLPRGRVERLGREFMAVIARLLTPEGEGRAEAQGSTGSRSAPMMEEAKRPRRTP